MLIQCSWGKLAFEKGGLSYVGYLRFSTECVLAFGVFSGEIETPLK
jgi:hypothetical protein